MRDIKEELEVSPDDEALNQLKEGIGTIIEKGLQTRTLKDSIQKSIELEKLENQLNDLTEIASENKRTNTLVQRIVIHKNDMLRFADNEEVEYHNNRAKRTIRAAVIFRKISFGNRTLQGAQDYIILTSVLETCRQKGEGLTSFLKNVLITPNDQLHHIAKSLLDTS